MSCCRRPRDPRISFDQRFAVWAHRVTGTARVAIRRMSFLPFFKGFSSFRRDVDHRLEARLSGDAARRCLGSGRRRRDALCRINRRVDRAYKSAMTSPWHCFMQAPIGGFARLQQSTVRIVAPRVRRPAPAVWTARCEKVFDSWPSWCTLLHGKEVMFNGQETKGCQEEGRQEEGR